MSGIRWGEIKPCTGCQVGGGVVGLHLMGWVCGWGIDGGVGGGGGGGGTWIRAHHIKQLKHCCKPFLESSFACALNALQTPFQRLIASAVVMDCIKIMRGGALSPHETKKMQY